MVEEEYREGEEALGGSWRSFFEDDPDALFDYTDRAYDEYEETLERVMQLTQSEFKVSRGHA